MKKLKSGRFGTLVAYVSTYEATARTIQISTSGEHIMKKQGGFTLIELMIVVAIIGILAAVAVPQYQQFQRKAKFSDAISQTAAFKSGVELCLQMNNGVGTSCDAGASGEGWSIPAAIASGSGKGSLDSISVVDGKITATSISTNGLSGETYILTPTANGATITWDKAGTCTSATPPIC